MSLNRVWVITGVNSGLGLALALHVASQGDKVVGTVRALSKFPEQLKEAGVLPLVVDLSGSDDEVKKAGQDALEMFGKVDVLVNNAGSSVVGPIEELQVSDIRAQFQANFFGAIAFTQPFISHFRSRRSGHILNVSSPGGTIPLPSWGPYCMSKAALDMFTNILHYELKLFGVRVLGIMPGYFSTPFLSKVPKRQSGGSSADANDSSGAQLSKVYTDTETQGYDVARAISKQHVETRQIGDPEKYAKRVYEIVTGTGMAKNLDARPTADGKWEGPWEVNRIPLGTDCYARLEEHFEAVGENLKIFEPIANSTDVEQERLKYFLVDN